jgi:hypothetical protein
MAPSSTRKYNAWYTGGASSWRYDDKPTDKDYNKDGWLTPHYHKKSHKGKGNWVSCPRA